MKCTIFVDPGHHYYIHVLVYVNHEPSREENFCTEWGDNICGTLWYVLSPVTICVGTTIYVATRAMNIVNKFFVCSLIVNMYMIKN